jgi:DNA-binding NarL/FixJ family response regulator
MKKTFRVLLADDHGLVLAGLRLLLERIEGATVVAEASNGREAVEMAEATHPDLAILDIGMRELNGIDAAERIRAALPGTKVLILSSHTGEDFVRRALKAGVAGYLVKASIPLELRMAVEAVLAGHMYLSPAVAKSLAAAASTPGASSMLEALSPRQREVLQLIAEGSTTKQIAFTLGVSVKTVETHRAIIMQRLGIRDVPGLVLFAVRHGLVHVDRDDP